MSDIQVLLSILAFVAAVVLTRLIFSIPTIVRNLKAQTQLLSIIAKKSGATDEEIKEAVEPTDLKLKEIIDGDRSHL